jgi:nucleoside-diphosphate-sugar epimerase
MGSIAEQLHPVLLEDFHFLREGLETSRLKGSRWLITGATGFVPAYLVKFLCWLDERDSLGIQLELWVRSIERARDRFPWVEVSGRNVRLKVPDWSDPSGWLVPPAEYLIHASSPATPAACLSDPDGVRMCNVEATRALVDTADTKALRSLLFFSSSEVYGETGENAFPDEASLGDLDPQAQRSNYPLSKREGEAICREAGKDRGLPVRMARIFHTYGPGMDIERDGRVFADLVGNAVHGEHIVLKSDGSGKRAFSYLGDTTAALVMILLDGGKGEAYNVGNPDAILSVSELADLIIGLVPEKNLFKRVLGDASVQSASAGVFPNITKLRKLGWQPRVSPQDGFTRTLRYFLP